MTPKKSKPSECSPPSCCKAEAMVSVDERGQMVLPKDLREKIGLRPGDKLALFSMNKDGEPCCLFLVKAERIADMAKGLFGDDPILKA